ncbi:DUF4240 domain-containing protein [Actinoplanes sp. CA-054009]
MAVTVDEFWELIHRSAAAGGKDARTSWLSEHLARVPTTEIVDFELRLTEQRKRVDTWLMWGAARCVMRTWASNDSFWYFQPWLVGLGRDAFDRVAADPDALARLPEVRRLAGPARAEWSHDEWPDWEVLNYVAVEAYRLATGRDDGLDEVLEARGHDRVCDPAPEGEPWDYDDAGQRRERLPRLSELFG